MPDGCGYVAGQHDLIVATKLRSSFPTLPESKRCAIERGNAAKHAMLENRQKDRPYGVVSKQKREPAESDVCSHPCGLDSSINGGLPPTRCLNLPQPAACLWPGSPGWRFLNQ